MGVACVVAHATRLSSPNIQLRYERERNQASGHRASGRDNVLKYSRTPACATKVPSSATRADHIFPCRSTRLKHQQSRDHGQRA